MCYLLVLAVITSGAFFVEPLCTKRKRIFNPPLSLHLSFFLSFELSILPSFKYHVFSLSSFLSPIPSHPPFLLLTTPVLSFPPFNSLYLFASPLFSTVLSLTVHSTLIFIFSLCLLSFSIFFPVMLFIPLRHCHFVIWCFMGCLNFRNHSFCLSPALLKDSLVFRKLCFFLHWLNTPDCSV